jgi:hypothetical protein
MSLQQQEPAHRFGSDDHMVCPECGNPMRLTRRAPHLVLGAAYERQILTCQNCSHQAERNADGQGNPLPASGDAGGQPRSIADD